MSMSIADRVKAALAGGPAGAPAPAASGGPAVLNPFATQAAAPAVAQAPPQTVPAATAPVNPFAAQAPVAAPAPAAVNPFAATAAAKPAPAPPEIPGGLINPPERHLITDPAEPLEAAAANAAEPAPAAEAAPKRGRGRPKGSTSATTPTGENAVDYGNAPVSVELQAAQVRALDAFTSLCQALERKWGA